MVQEAALRAWRSLDQFRGGPDEEQTGYLLRAWLEQIAHHVGLNAVRDRHAAKRLPPEARRGLPTAGDDSHDRLLAEPVAGGSSIAAHVVTAEAEERVQRAIAQLQDTLDRQIVLMRFRDALSLREISVQLGISREDARRRFHAALRQLKNVLQDLSP
jgi:RNA polymerase sigma factor (sigma-70 family)